MFKRIGNTLQVGKSSIPLMDGTYEIYLRKDDLSVYVKDPNKKEDLDSSELQSDYVLIAEYTFNKKQNTLIINKKAKEIVDGKKNKIKHPFIIGRSMWNNARIHSGPLYGSGELDTPISGYLEGLPIDFNYSSFMMSTIALAMYPWVGGRSCFQVPIFGGSMSVPFYTAKPFMSCGIFTPKMMFELSISVIFPLGTVDALMDAFDNWIYNRFSLVLFLYSHRRYTDIQINNEESFYIKDSQNKLHAFSPLGEQNEETYSIPDFNNNFSMFNLMQ